MSGMKNVVTMNAITQKAEAEEHGHITTGAFNLGKVQSGLQHCIVIWFSKTYSISQRHALAQKYMELFARDFKGKGRAEVGPMKFSMAIRTLCQHKGNASFKKLNGTVLQL